MHHIMLCYALLTYMPSRFKLHCYTPCTAYRCCTYMCSQLITGHATVAVTAVEHIIAFVQTPLYFMFKDRPCWLVPLFEQVIVDAIDPSAIVSNCATKTFDFGSIKESELTNITIPLQLQVGMSALFASPTRGSNCHV